MGGTSSRRGTAGHACTLKHAQCSMAPRHVGGPARTSSAGHVVLRAVTDTGANASASGASVRGTGEHRHDGSVTDVRVGIGHTRASQHATDASLDYTSGVISASISRILGASAGCCCSGGVGHLVYTEIKLPFHRRWKVLSSRDRTTYTKCTLS
jgi:hypothetical protein